MSLLTLSPRDRRALAVGGTVMIAALTLARGFPALRTWTNERRASAVELNHELSQLRLGVASQRERKAALTKRSAELASLESALLPGETPATGAASLARLVGTAAESSAVHIRSTQLRTDSIRAGDAYTRVAVRIDATSDIRGLTSFLARLERGPALLVVKSLAITQSEPLSEMETLRAELEVAGLARAHDACECRGPECRCAQSVEASP